MLSFGSERTQNSSICYLPHLSETQESLLESFTLLSTYRNTD